MTQSFRSQPFNPAVHGVEDFHCGVDSLDSWIREQAAAASLRGTARTWVWVDERGEVAGYYALAAHKVTREQVPNSIGRGGPAEIPAVLLARLALDVRLQGEGLGVMLVADAMRRVLAATQTVAARLVVVDAHTEDVAGFYEQLGFRRIPGSLMLVQKMSDIAAALAAQINNAESDG